MLVITRRSADKIAFPQVGITIHFIRVQGSSAKVGVDAPRDVVIVRDDSPEATESAARLRKQWLRLPKQVRHDIRNELHAMSVGIHLLREQLRAGLQDDAQDTFSTIQEAIDRLSDNHLLRKPNEGEPGTLPGTIVVVEDNDNEREMLAGLLRLQGHPVVCLRDGDEALEYLNSHDAPKVVLMDMRMPRCDGASAVRQLRSNNRHDGTKIFAITGAEPTEYKLEIGDRGVNRWFNKPLNPQFLLEAL